jgi:hypothetical protein
MFSFSICICAVLSKYYYKYSDSVRVYVSKVLAVLHSFVLLVSEHSRGNHVSILHVNPMQAFFQRWWNDQSEAVQKIVKQLVSSGQLEFM